LELDDAATEDADAEVLDASAVLLEPPAPVSTTPESVDVGWADEHAAHAAAEDAATRRKANRMRPYTTLVMDVGTGRPAVRRTSMICPSRDV
jgi:hypothetical protein